MPTLKTFVLDDAVLARHIYRDYQHMTTCSGLTIEQPYRTELSSFLRSFLNFIDCKEHIFMRLDVFIGNGKLHVIEINVELQDGWGVALNLLRASGNKLKLINGFRLPTEIIVYSEDYLPEFELARQELGMIGHEMQVVNWSERRGVLQKSTLDDKLYLAKFSRTWKGHLVHVPAMYDIENCSWNALPTDVVFKFREKYGEQARKARYSVIPRSGIGKGKFIRRCYNDGSVVAQKYLTPSRLKDGSATQAIIMCSGAEPITGYLQVAPADVFVINDKTAHKGPLVLE